MVMIPSKPKTADSAPAAASKGIPAKVAKPAAVVNEPGPAAQAEVVEQAPAVETVTAAAVEAPAPAPAPAPLVLRPAGAVVVAGRPVDIVMQTYKDAFTVDWNTLHRIQASNGNFLDVESNKASIGAEITLEVLSYQANFQISPGTDDDDDIQYVRYSDDGKITSQGEDCHEYLAALKAAGYEQAKMGERMVLAGTLVGGVLDGKLVQLNLAPTSKAMFDRFKMQASLDVAKGKRTAADIAVLKLKAIVQTKGKNSWTVVQFDYGA